MERKHVYAVDGAADFLSILQQLLQDEQYRVTTADGVPADLTPITAEPPDLVIVDLAVGEESGWVLLERLCRDPATQGIPVIVTSTSAELLEQVQASPDRYGGNWFLRKPIDLDDLLTAAKHLTRLPSSRYSD